jgi:hypothetical protein
LARALVNIRRTIGYQSVRFSGSASRNTRFHGTSRSRTPCRVKRAERFSSAVCAIRSGRLRAVASNESCGELSQDLQPLLRSFQ